jgi:hypothetical protein
VLPDKYFISESVMQLQYLRFSFSSFLKPVTQSSVKHPMEFNLNSHHRCIQVFSPLEHAKISIMHVGTPKGSQLFSCLDNKLTKVAGAATYSKFAENKVAVWS